MFQVARVNMEHSEVEIASAAFVVFYHKLKKEEMKKRKRRHWVAPLLKSRDVHGGNQLLNDLIIGSTDQFGIFCRMSSDGFEHLLTLIEPAIRKQDTNYRDAISPKERLAITLRFLATGDSYTSLMYLFKISKQSISTIVIDVCRALNDVLRNYI